MSWWRQPFTIMYVPHDGSQARRLTLKRITFLSLIFLGAFFISTGLILSLFAMQNPHRQIAEKPNQNVTETESTNNKDELAQLKQTIHTLQNELHKTHKRHQKILKVAGLANPNQTESPIAPGTEFSDWMQVGDQLLDQTIERNEQLKQLDKFVRNRNKVFRHTPTLWPTEGWMSSPYGYRQDPMGGKGRSFHDGIDIAAWHGNPVRATADGTVTYSGVKSGYGNVVEIEHEYGYTTLYAHLSERLVKKGTRVNKGSAVGRVGNTGHSTGSHVHYEVHVNGETVNPWPYLVEEFQSFKQYAMKGDGE